MEVRFWSSPGYSVQSDNHVLVKEHLAHNCFVFAFCVSVFGRTSIFSRGTRWRSCCVASSHGNPGAASVSTRKLTSANNTDYPVCMLARFKIAMEAGQLTVIQRLSVTLIDDHWRIWSMWDGWPSSTSLHVLLSSLPASFSSSLWFIVWHPDFPNAPRGVLTARFPYVDETLIKRAEMKCN